MIGVWWVRWAAVVVGLMAMGSCSGDDVAGTPGSEFDVLLTLNSGEPRRAALGAAIDVARAEIDEFEVSLDAVIAPLANDGWVLNTVQIFTELGAGQSVEFVFIMLDDPGATPEAGEQPAASVSFAQRGSLGGGAVPDGDEIEAEGLGGARLILVGSDENSRGYVLSTAGESADVVVNVFGPGLDLDKVLSVNRLIELLRTLADS